MSKIDLEKALTFVQKTSNKGVINSFILFVIVFFPSWMVITLFRSVMVQKESGAIVWGSMGIDAFFSTTGISLSVIIAFFLFLSLNGTVKEILKNFVYGKPMKLRIKEILMITGGVAGGIFLYDMTVTSLFFRDAPERLQSAIGLLSFSFPVAIVIAIVAAVGEEMFFRGVIQESLHKNVEDPKNGRAMFLCIGIPAFLFAIAHYGTQSTLSLFINILPISLVLGYVYAKYRSILINTTIHATVNVLAIAVLFWSLPSYVPNASHFSIIPDSIKSETLKDSVTVADRVAYLTIVTSTGGKSEDGEPIKKLFTTFQLENDPFSDSRLRDVNNFNAHDLSGLKNAYEKRFSNLQATDFQKDVISKEVYDGVSRDMLMFSDLVSEKIKELSTPKHQNFNW